MTFEIGQQPFSVDGHTHEIISLQGRDFFVKLSGRESESLNEHDHSKKRDSESHHAIETGVPASTMSDSNGSVLL